jgi:RimK family alpha-L-glutamate ligase
MFLFLTQGITTSSSKRFIEEANKMDIPMKILNPYDSSLLFNQSNLSFPENNFLTTKGHSSLFGLHRCTGTNFDDFDLLFSQSLLNKGIKIYNNPSSIKKIRGKDNQLLFFLQNSLPHIPTLCFKGRPQKEIIEKLTDYFRPFQHKEKFVLKTTRGNRGLGVNLINGKSSLFSILETFWAMKDQRFILQPFIESFEEYRVFIIKNKFLGAIKKKTDPSSFDFRKNCERSHGALKFLKSENLSPTIRDLSEKTFKEAGCLYLGLDIILTNDGPLLLEINTVPGFAQLETVSEQNVAKEIIMTLKQ